jgi:DNA-binding NtrC family response regulator
VLLNDTETGVAMTTKRKILIIDDDEDLQEMVRMLLEHYDFECHTALNVSDGLALYQQHYFDLVLLDMHFQDLVNGIAFLESVKSEANVGEKSTPIMMMSSDRDTSVVESALKNGAKGFIAKPLQPLRFVKSVYEYVN